MPLTPLAYVVITICLNFILFWIAAVIYKNRKISMSDKLNFAVTMNFIISSIGILIACVSYFLGFIK